MVNDDNEKKIEIEEKPFYKTKKGILAIIAVCCVGILVVGGIASILSPDKTSTSSTTSTDDQTTSASADPFNGNNAKMENVSISSSYSYFDVNGKIMFKYDESYASLEAEVTLTDDSKISESIVKNWNNVKKDQWYTMDGNLFSTSGNDYSISDIKSVDFIYDGEVIYTWNNE